MSSKKCVALNSAKNQENRFQLATDAPCVHCHYQRSSRQQTLQRWQYVEPYELGYWTQAVGL